MENNSKQEFLAYNKKLSKMIDMQNEMIKKQAILISEIQKSSRQSAMISIVAITISIISLVFAFVSKIFLCW